MMTFKNDDIELKIIGAKSSAETVQSGTKQNNSFVEFTLDPEYFRLAAYACIFISIGFGMMLTKLINVQRGWVDETENIIYEHFGYINLCFYIDELPARYFGLFGMTLYSFFWVAYEISLYFLTKISHKKGELTDVENYVFASIMWFNCLAAAYFLQVFTVHPSKSFFMHTLPFSISVLALSVNGVRNVYFQIRAGWWRSELDTNNDGILSSKELLRIWYVYVYLALLVIFSVAKVIIQFMGIVFLNPPPTWLGQSNDVVWLLLAVVAPFLYGIWHIKYASKNHAHMLDCNVSTTKRAC